MALAIAPCYRCSSCGSRDCCWTAPSMEYNHLWLLLPYPSPPIDILLRCYPMATCYSAVRSRAPRLLSQRYSSRATGGNFLHALLHNFGATHPEVIQNFITERTEDHLCTAREMLLQRDSLGNLPLHVSSSVGVPWHLLRELLRQTLAAQKTFSIKMVPYVMTTNDSGYSLLDIELMRFIDCDLGAVASIGPCYKVSNQSSVYSKIMQDAVHQRNSSCERNIRYGSGRSAHWCSFTRIPTISNLFLTRIKCVICAAYEEFQYLVQRQYGCCMAEKSHRCTRSWLHLRCENVSLLLDWISNTRSEWSISTLSAGSKSDGDPLADNDCPYVLHYASALSGPTTSTMTCGRNNNLNIPRTASLLQVPRSFLELLLEDDPVRACNVPHPTTGMLPLHFAVQSGLALLGNQHDSRFSFGSYHKTCKRKGVNFGIWNEWIQRLMEIDSTTCSKMDFMNRIPLHYVLLQYLQRRFYNSDGGDDIATTKTLDEGDQNEALLFLLIRSHPGSIEIPCRLRFRVCLDPTVSSEVMLFMPRGKMNLYTEYSCNFEVFQVAAMVYPVVSLNTLYSILRMCPSRCFRGNA